MEALNNIISSVLNNQNRTLKFLFSLLFILFIFSFLILAPLWLAKKLQLLPFSSSIILEDARSKIESSNVIEEEKELRLIDNVAISAEVMTFDDFKLNENELNRLEKVIKKIPFDKNEDSDAKKFVFDDQYKYFKNGFNLVDRWKERSFPITDISFRRFIDLFEDPKITKNLSTNARKEVILTEDYWKGIKNGVKIMTLPTEKQYSVTVLKIHGVKNNGTLYIANDSKSNFNNQLKIATGQNFFTIPNTGDILFICMAEGERIHFESLNYSWDITINRILNMPMYRSDKDVTLIDYSYTLK